MHPLSRDAATPNRLASTSKPLVERRREFKQARVGLAGIRFETQRPGEAVIQLNRAIELDPNDEVAWYRLARALRLTGAQQGQRKALAEFSASAPSKAALGPHGDSLRSRRRDPPATERNHTARRKEYSGVTRNIYLHTATNITRLVLFRTSMIGDFAACAAVCRFCCLVRGRLED